MTRRYNNRSTWHLICPILKRTDIFAMKRTRLHKSGCDRAAQVTSRTTGKNMDRLRGDSLMALVLVFILSAWGGVSSASTQSGYVLYDDFEDGVMNLGLRTPRGPHATPPIASFKWLKVVGLDSEGGRTTDVKHMVGAIIRFDPSESFSPTGEIIMYVWDFDNGITIIADSPNVYDMKFKEARVYHVRLTVTDDGGLTHAFEETIDLSSKEI
jgi:hypothetical protein